MTESPLAPSFSLVAGQRPDPQSRTQSHRLAGTAWSLQPSGVPGPCGHRNRPDFPPGRKIPGFICDLVPVVVLTRHKAGRQYWIGRD